MTVLAVYNQKGGVGKTTTSVNLGACLAELGRSVLLLDMDYQAAATRWLVGGEVEPSDGIEAVLSGERGLLDVVRETPVERMSLVASTKHLNDFEKTFIQDPGAALALEDAFKGAQGRASWDYVIIDCSNVPGIITVNALTVAEEVLVPVKPAVMDVDGFVLLHETVSKVKKRLNPGLQITGVVATMVNFRTTNARETIGNLRGTFGEVVYETVIRQGTRLEVAPRYGVPIVQFDPKSNGAADYRSLTREFLRRHGEAETAPAESGVATTATPEAVGLAGHV